VIIGVDARAAAEVPAGRGRMLRELLAAMHAIDPPHRLILYCRRPWDQVPSGPRLEWVPIGLRDPAWHAAVALHASRSCDVFLSTNSYLTAWMLGVPCALIIYDLVAFLPEARARKGAARIERATIRPAIRRAARLVCISRSTETDLVRLFPRARGKTTVVPLAADERFHIRRPPAELKSVAKRYGVEFGGYVLASGTLEPRKNLVRLIGAHAALPDQLRRRNPLLIVGPRGWEEQELRRVAAQQGEDVRLAGFVSDDDLAALYAACSVFCYPSLYEGFGLPVLEAMAAGAAVVTSDVSSLPEVGGDAVVYVEPRDEKSIATALKGLLSAPEQRAALGVRARVRASKLSWERVAGEVLSELERAAGVAQSPSTRS
jgi:alpha-1,3-rhamnosyl/mannosyltransferase